ncbi:3-phosphoshikimate 1-carboxyvinyltransferase [Colwellia echini]|uniref:3-phosphoshikimate 1-carboxyvinyltransferase n=1 Tax=Colwellia echini TaxID=1982103 RepID=A0ABY3MU92_9GAMM|nr:3-phosphoshikimate 1-carboxyvinyltransferase [Colwellia echini]TYK64786.1 3-phosphoshikimate 1-carboxyvinyltransferase [Colwellia echini]
MSQSPKKIRDEQTIKGLLEKMPPHVAESFNDEQLTHLFTILCSRSWGKHTIDLRGTFKIPLYKWRFYYVFLTGRNHRDLSRKEKELSLVTKGVVVSVFLLISTCMGILILYLLKSALGIDILPNFSLGIWSWFKSAFE